MNEDYSYLNGLSKEAQEIIIQKVIKGEPNLFQSIMVVLGNRRHRGVLQDCATENKHYRKNSKRNTNLSGISEPLFNEIFEYTYNRFTSKPRKKINRPITSKENMTIAKGAMILALQKCNVSEKNITGMLGVMDKILNTTSEYELKNVFREYVKDHQEKEG